MSDIVEEGKTQEVEQGKTTPESVPYHQYVGLQQKFNKVEAGYKEHVSSLEERLKTAVSVEDHTKIKEELDSVKTEHQKLQDELKGIHDKTISEKRESLKAKGFSEEDLADLDEKAMNILMKTLSSYRPTPAPDMGSGGGSGELRGSPMELAMRAYSNSK